MKSVKKVFKKKLSPYNLRSRKSAVPVVKASTPKVNREVQASLSEEENCTLLCELPYYRSSIHELTHAIDLNEENQPSGLSNGPRLSTAFSSPSQADSTNREAINISIEQRQESSIVQPSSSKQSTPCGPRVVSDSSSLEDFTPLDSRYLQSGPQIALEVDEISEPEHGEPEPEQDSSFAHNLNPLINSQLTCHSQVRDRDSINYKKPKQNKTVKTKTRSDSVSSADSRYRETDSERRDSEDSEDEQGKNINEEKRIRSEKPHRVNERDQPDLSVIMEADAFRKLQEQMATLQNQLRLQHRAQQQTASALEQAPIPETVSTRRPAPFHGYDSEDVNRWLDKIENYLTLRRIDLTSRTAQAELVMNLAGPAEDFYYSLPPDRKSTYVELRDSLRERFANDNQSWIIWQAVTTRQQGAIEPLDTYLTDLTNKFRRLNITDAEKMRYFVQGLRPEVRETVLLRQPKSFREAEEIARLTCAVKNTMISPDVTRPPSHPVAVTEASATSLALLAKMDEISEKLQKNKEPAKAEATLTDAKLLAKLDAWIAGLPAIPSIQQTSPLQAKLNELVEKTPSRGENAAILAAYAEPNKRETPDYMREICRMEDKLEELSRQIDARIKGLARRNSPNQVEQPRQRTREGRPICYTCGRVGHIQQNCNQRSSRETSNYDRFQPNQQRRPTNDNYPSRSGYNQTQRRNELPSFNPRNPRMAVLDEDYDDGFVAPLEQDTINQTIPEEGSNFLRIDWGNVGSQIGKELTQQLTNTSPVVPEVIQQSPVKKNQLPTVIIEVPKLRSESDQQTMEQNNESKVTCEATTADRSERKLPGNLETKPKSEAHQYLATSPLDPSKSSGVQVNALPQSQEKLHLLGTAPFPNAVRRSKSRITADTDVIVELSTEGIIERSSDPDPSQPQHSSSTGSESTAINKDSLPNCMPGPIQTTCETPPSTAEQCNISDNQAKPRDLTVTAQLNGQDIKLLVDTGAGMAVTDEQFTRDIYKGEPPKLKKRAPANVQTVSSEELLARSITKYDDSQSRDVNTAVAAFSEANNKQTPELLKEIRQMENSLTERLENLNQRVNCLDRLARRNYTVCYRCGRTGHIQYNCYYYYRPESLSQNQEKSQEFLAHYNQEESQRLPANPSARLSALDAQFPQRVLNYHVNKANSSGSVQQASRPQERTCNLAFEGEENSPGHVLAVLPKQERTTSQGRVSSNTQSHQDVKTTGANKRQRQISHKQVPLPTTNYRQSKSAAQPSDDLPSVKKDFKLKCSDLTTEGEIAGQAVQLLVDTGACVSAIDEQLFTKIYSQLPTKMSESSLSSVQTVSGDKVPVLGKITIPLQLQGREYICEFHVMQHLAYDAILGRDFLQNNGALIDLVDNTLSFKGTGYDGAQSSTKTVPVMGTFLSQHKNLKEKNAVASDANQAPFPVIFLSKFVQRNEKSKLMFSHQSLLLLLLIVLYLLTASCTSLTENNDKPVIQKLPELFDQDTPDDIPQDGYVIWTPVSLANRKKSDQSKAQSERKVSRVKILK